MGMTLPEGSREYNRQIFEYLNTFEEKSNYVQLSLFN